MKLVVLATLFLSSAEAQIDPSIKVDRQLVLVDVVVDGGAAAALTRDAFRIYDNGQQQKIAVFEVVSGETDTKGATPLPAGVVSNRRNWLGAVPNSATVILLDRINTPTAAQVDVNRQVQELVKSFENKQSIALYELRSDGLRIVHDFDADPRQLAERAAKLEAEHSLALDSSTRTGGFESELSNVGLDPLLGESRTGNAGFDRKAADYFLNDRALRTSTALETIARHMQGLRGRRNLVWLAGRFPFSFDIRSRADLRQEIESSTLKQIDDVSIFLNETNIAVYPVDVRGPGGEGAEVAGIAQEIAKATGGRAFRTNAVNEAVRFALADSRVIYKLGFYPSQPTKDSSRRSLRVEVPGHSADLLYRTRYTGSDQPLARGGVAELGSSSLDATGIGLSGMAAPAQGGSGAFELVTLLDLADIRLRERDGRMEGSIVVGLIFRADDNGTVYVIPPVTNKITMSQEEYRAFQKTGFPLQRFLNTEGRNGAVRIVVQDRATGLAGSLWIPVKRKN